MLALTLNPQLSTGTICVYGQLVKFIITSSTQNEFSFSSLLYKIPVYPVGLKAASCTLPGKTRSTMRSCQLRVVQLISNVEDMQMRRMTS